MPRRYGVGEVLRLDGHTTGLGRLPRLHLQPDQHKAEKDKDSAQPGRQQRRQGVRDQQAPEAQYGNDASCNQQYDSG